MSLKCLIVEDSPFMCEIYRHALRDNIHLTIVAEAQDGLMAMKLLEEIKPDILILDLVLPLKNGIDILREIESISFHTKTIVVSSIEDEAIISQAKALGAIVYLKKPFSKQQLLSAVEEVSASYSGVLNG